MLILVFEVFVITVLFFPFEHTVSAFSVVVFFLLLVMSNVDSVGVLCHYCAVSLVVFFANTLKWLHQHQHQQQQEQKPEERIWFR